MASLVLPIAHEARVKKSGDIQELINVTITMLSLDAMKHLMSAVSCVSTLASSEALLLSTCSTGLVVDIVASSTPDSISVNCGSGLTGAMSV